MQIELTKKTLSKHLKLKALNITGLDYLKVVYRPYFCPFDRILNYIPIKGATIFDIGCGHGILLALLAQFNQPERLGGIDTNVSAIQNAKKLVDWPTEKLFISQYNGIHLPKQICEFDYVTMIDVLHHIPLNQKIEFIESIYSAMTKGAKLILTDIDEDSKLVYFNRFHDKLMNGSAGTEIPARETKKILEKIGFKIIAESKELILLYPHYTLVAQK